MSAASARCAIAAAFLGAPADPVMKIGQITLEPHQAAVLPRLRAALAEFGGVLLCDPVGTGKTFTALALATAHRRSVVVAPAVLASMWRNASASCGVAIEFVSHESLSRRRPGLTGFDFVIVDEAHHARNPATRRFIALAELVSGREMILLTATPVHNGSRDLHALLSLFLGTRSATIANAELGRCVIRRDDPFPAGTKGIPGISPLRWIEIPAEESVVDALLSLPPPLPPRDGGNGGALIAHSLVRQWASSDAALRGGLQRRIRRAIALSSALESGIYPTARELESWSSGPGAVQLAFSELLASPAGDSVSLLRAIEAHRDGVERVLRIAGCESARDDAIAAAIREIRQASGEMAIVAFSQYGDTIAALFRRLVRDGAVAALSGRGARVAGGGISRDDVIARFAPRASGVSPPRVAEQVTLLLTTDLMSEGVNLQDAGVIIHLDLPWTPAKMEQRLGRIARMGSSHSRVHAYALRPPAAAELEVRLEKVLEAKVCAASRIVSAFPSLAVSGAHDPERSEPHIVEALRRKLSIWLDGADPIIGGTLSHAAATCAPRSGFIAACIRGDRTMLIASLDGRITDDPRVIMQCAGFAEGRDRMPEPDEIARARSAIDSYVEAAAALEGADAGSSRSRVSRQRAFRRTARAVGDAAVHCRPRVASLAVEARRSIDRTVGAHEENALAAIESSAATDEQLLELMTRPGLPQMRPMREIAGDVAIAAIVLFAGHRR